VGYYPGCIDLLTRRPYRAGRQCQVGSLTPTRITGWVSEPDAEGWCSIGAEAPTYALHLHPIHNDRV